MPESTRFSKHPDFEKALLDWVVASDCYEGERVIKERKTTYLPATSGQISLGLGYDGETYPEPASKSMTPTCSGRPSPP